MKFKYILFVIGIISILFTASCTISSTPAEVVCNKPYILVGTECCLDKNDNSICDTDDTIEKSSTGKIRDSITEKEIETKNEVEESVVPEYTISDLQADIGNIIYKAESEFLVLQKDMELEDVEFFTFNRNTALRLGKYPEGPKNFFKVNPKKIVIVSIFKDEKEYIKTGKSFFDFINKHSSYLFNSIELKKDLFVQEFTEGNALDRIKVDKTVVDYVAHESTETSIVDDFELLETISNKIVLRNLISIDDYSINYTRKVSSESSAQNKIVNLRGLNYIQSSSIYCTPQITITLFREEVPIRIDITPQDIGNYYKNEMERIRADAQALITMCEDRYDFEFFRYR